MIPKYTGQVHATTQLEYITDIKIISIRVPFKVIEITK